jgi:hypothetical protein
VVVIWGQGRSGLKGSERWEEGVPAVRCGQDGWMGWRSGEGRRGSVPWRGLRPVDWRDVSEISLRFGASSKVFCEFDFGTRMDSFRGLDWTDASTTHDTVPF